MRPSQLGALPPLASVTFVRVVNFSTYDATKRAIADVFSKTLDSDPLEHYAQPGSKPTILSMITFTGAGMVAGLVSAPIACKPMPVSHVTSEKLILPGPFELAKNVVQTSVLVANRSQAAPDAAQDHSLRSKPRLGTFPAIKQIIDRHGVRGLYTGFKLHMIRDTIGTGLYFGIYETVKQVAASSIGKDSSPLGGPMIAGAICSTVPWFCVSDKLQRYV